MKDIKKIYKKYKEIIMYLVFGVLTTLINIIVFYLCNSILKINWDMSNIVAWLLSVIFAYITNKKYVFNSKNKNIIKEISSFLIARLLSLGFDMLFMYLLIDVININNLISKIIVNVIVVILNYIFSKLFVFKKEVLK